MKVEPLARHLDQCTKNQLPVLRFAIVTRSYTIITGRHVGSYSLRYHNIVSDVKSDMTYCKKLFP